MFVFCKQEENATASGWRYLVPQLPSRKGMKAQRGGEAGGPPSAEASGCGLAVRPVTRRCPHGTLRGPSSAPLMRTCTSLRPAKNWGFQPRGQRREETRRRPLSRPLQGALRAEQGARGGCCEAGERGISYSCFLVIRTLTRFNGPVIAEPN